MRPSSTSLAAPAARPAGGGIREKLQFLRGLLASPAGVSAVAPSSPKMAAALAAQIPRSAGGRVLELGPGTGAVTEGIVARGFAPSRITAVEFDPRFAALLAERFTGLKIVQGDAFDLDRTLGPAREDYVAVMSGLPLINFPAAARRAVIDAGLARVPHGAPFIQISYRGKPAVPETSQLSVERAALVWRNLPPGYVWVYRRR